MPNKSQKSKKLTSVVHAVIAASALYFGVAHAVAVPHVVSSTVKMDASTIQFEDASRAWRDEGTFPNNENLSKLVPGLTKNEMYVHFGKPHFAEGFFAVREWNYVFKFNTPAGVVMCRYQAHFDGEMKLANTFWDSQRCADLAQFVSAKETFVDRPVPVAVATPAPAPAPITKFRLQGDALFAFGKSGIQDILPGGRTQLKRLAQNMASNVQDVQSITITGHTDRLGSSEFNDNLSLARAETIKAALMQEGVNATKVTAKGMGSAVPIKSCPGPASAPVIACLQDNRRVEIEIAGLADPDKKATLVSKDQKMSHNSDTAMIKSQPKWTPIVVRVQQ